MVAISVVTTIAGLCALCVLGLVLIVVVPSGRIRAEARLDRDVETRLLLGHDPAEIDRDLRAEDPAPTPVADLRPDE